MSDKNIIYKVYRFYRDGFRSMTIGRTLWTKLIVIFAVLKLFFFPDVVGRQAKNGDRATFVAGELTRR